MKHRGDHAAGEECAFERAGDALGDGAEVALAEQRADPVEPELPGPLDPTVDFSRTLGELLLTPNRSRLSSNVADRSAIRSILVLVPRIPERFTLTPAPTELPK